MHVTNLKKKIDKLGLLQAQWAELEKQIETLKDEIGALPAGPYEGAYYRASIVHGIRTGVPIQAALAKLRKLGVPRRWFTRNTKETPFTSITVRARTGKGLKAFQAEIHAIKTTYGSESLAPRVLAPSGGSAFLWRPFRGCGEPGHLRPPARVDGGAISQVTPLPPGARAASRGGR